LDPNAGSTAEQTPSVLRSVGQLKRGADQSAGRDSDDDLAGGGQSLQMRGEIWCAAHRELEWPPTPVCSPTTTEPVAMPIRTDKFSVERRQLTVMFCDLVGSTALGEKLDPDAGGTVRILHVLAGLRVDRPTWRFWHGPKGTQGPGADTLRLGMAS
jgi:hypothetical protein